MSTLALDRPIVRTMTLNALLCVGVVAIPALSHTLALPLYRLEPMRLLLFAAILFSGHRNALVMAVAMPLLSWMTSGHPVFPKVLLIQGELVLNTLIFFGLAQRTSRFLPAAMVSVVASKAAYYAAKAVLIQASLLSGSLIATPWIYQLATLAFILLVGGLVWSRQRSGRS